MIKLGISLYPEQETIEEIKNYISLASKYGFSFIFTSLFSVKGSKEEILAYFKKLCDIAHENKMMVMGDVNTEFFKKMGCNENDISFFKDMHLDIIRMDGCYMDERDVTLINNKEGIGIQMNACDDRPIILAVDNGADINNLTVCHNFYPQRYTGFSIDRVNRVNSYWKKKGVKVYMFITSHVKNSHGPWPVSDGLPTIEEHRDMPLRDQVKQILAMNNTDGILFGNAFASEEEFKEVADTVRDCYADDKIKLVFDIDVDSDISDIEEKVLFDTKKFDISTDSMYYMMRGRNSRVLYRDLSMAYRKCDKMVFKRGDVLIVNDNLKHYRNEVQVVLKDMVNDGKRNYLGSITKEDLAILDYIDVDIQFGFRKR